MAGEVYVPSVAKSLVVKHQLRILNRNRSPTGEVKASDPNSFPARASSPLLIL